ncbi:Protein kinase domain-containing protein [Pleurotus pulmonarius]
MADITPRSPAAHDFISGLYTSATMRSVVREELAGKVSEDDSAVFKRLEIDQVSDEFVDSCFETCITQHRGLFDELDEALVVAAQARTKMVYHDTQWAKGYSWEEEEIHPLLQQLCNIIADFSHPVELKATRNIKIAAGRQLKGEEYTTGFPKVTPDGTGSRVLECDSWMDTDWFVAIKPAESQGLAAEDAPISEVVCQAADYARLHMSCRPFQLFSVGLLILGRKFMVGIFDRDGVSLSPASDFCDAGEGFRTFIRVIRRLVSPLLSDIELGSDPTAQPLSPSSDLHATVRELAISRGLSPDFPPYVVLCPRQYSTTNGVTSTTWEQNAWLTVGPAIWVSLSLIGRGTNIWPVVPLISNSGKYAIVDGAPLSILKNAWRNSERTGEASIYGSLNAPPPGVARFLQGGDVRFDSETDIPISVHNLRRQYPYGAWLHRVATNAAASVPPGTGTGTGTAVLHRLILQTIGRPLWQFASYMELLKAFRAAIVGHQRLIAQGILHRDISAGNIMISANDTPGVGEEGFLMDLEFARIDEVVHVTKVPGGPQHTTWSAPKRGIQMTGTVQFMAREILDSVFQNKPIEHTESHDLESFAWVFAYVVFRRLLRDSDGETTKFSKEDRIAIEKLYEQSFGALKLDAVLTQREALKPFKIAGTRINSLVPAAIAYFMRVLGVLVPQERLTHDKLVYFIDKSLASLEEEMQVG